MRKSIDFYVKNINLKYNRLVINRFEWHERLLRFFHSVFGHLQTRISVNSYLDFFWKQFWKSRFGCDLAFNASKLRMDREYGVHWILYETKFDNMSLFLKFESLTLLWWKLPAYKNNWKSKTSLSPPTGKFYPQCLVLCTKCLLRSMYWLLIDWIILRTNISSPKLNVFLLSDFDIFQKRYQTLIKIMDFFFISNSVFEKSDIYPKRVFDLIFHIKN